MVHFTEVAGGTGYSMAKVTKSGLMALNTSESLPKAIKKAVEFMFGMTPRDS